MFEAIEQLEREELDLRYARCREVLKQMLPDAAGVAIFHPVNTYYFTGTLATGFFWLPLEGEPVLLLRRGLERAALESPLKNVHAFRSYSEVPGLLAEAGSPLPGKNEAVAVGMAGLSWSLGEMLRARIPDCNFVSGDHVIDVSRSVKTPWELAKMRLAGARHDYSLQVELPKLIKPGMNEREISHLAWQVFFQQGHSGHMRMRGYGQEIFLGHVACGDSANYPSHFNGPVGLRGEHPAIPYMGYAGKVWQQDEPLTCDIGFSLEGYVTDKTQVYWPGTRASVPDRVARAHQNCMDIQQYVASQMKPGAIPSELWATSLKMADEAGFAEEYMALGTNKVHFLGHGIGLFVDEYPVIAKGFDAPLEEGMVMALEPKAGIPGLGMVGVENTFEVTKDGGACLTGESFDMIYLEELS